eukprot:g10394.t1
MTDEGGAAKTDGKETEIDIPISVPADGAATGAEGAGPQKGLLGRRAAAAPAEGAATESAADGAPAAPAETPADGAADPAAPAAPAEAPASGGDVSADASADPSAPAAPAGSAETPVDPAEPGAPAAPADGPAETPAAEDKVDDTGTGEAKPETDKVGDGGKTDDPKPPGEEEPKDDAAKSAVDRLSKGVEGLRTVAPRSPIEARIVLDAKRGDIGSTSEAYASSAFQTLRCDSVTASPYLGGDGLQPFLKDASRGVWVLCKTSNPGSQDVQALELPNGEPLYLHVAKLCCGTWAKEHQNAGLVVGATDVEAMQKIRTLEDWAQKMNLHVQELRTFMDGAAEPPVPPLPGTLEEETRAQVTEEELQSVRDIGRQLASHRTGRTTDAEEWTDPEESAKEVEELRRVRRQIRYIFGGMLQSLPEAGTLRVEPWLKE